MHIFISYAKKDTRDLALDLRDELVNVPGVTAWMDESLRTASSWAIQIQDEIDRADLMIVLLSPDVNRPETPTHQPSFVLNEIGYARQERITILPIMAQMTKQPVQIAGVEYIDMTSDPAAGMQKLMQDVRQRSGIEKIEEMPAAPSLPTRDRFDVNAAMRDFYNAQTVQDWYTARDLLNQIQESGQAPYFITYDREQAVDKAIRELEAAVAAAAEAVEAKAAAAAQYDGLLVMAQHDTPERVWAALLVFWESYPDYDPDGLDDKFRPTVADILPQPFEWIDIPGGKVTLVTEKGWTTNYLPEGETKTFTVEPFSIAKYPITNAQYQVFVDAPDGYQETKWWNYSDDAMKWRAENPQPGNTAFVGDDHPRTNVNWFDSVAFCRWLTTRMGWTRHTSSLQITLPTEQQWQRAAQGDTNRMYPWGDKFDKSLSNTRKSGLKRTTPVTQYPSGASPYGVMDMSGNMWEWCLTEYESGSIDLQGNNSRVLRGGSWGLTNRYVRAVFRRDHAPGGWNDFGGFRLVCAPV